jgi:hypothetical protein
MPAGWMSECRRAGFFGGAGELRVARVVSGGGAARESKVRRVPYAVSQILRQEAAGGCREQSEVLPPACVDLSILFAAEASPSSPPRPAPPPLSPQAFFWTHPGL